MKAIRSHLGHARIDLDAAEPVPGPGEALVTPIRLAVDHLVARRSSGFSGVLGHEFVGEVRHLELPEESPLHGRLAGRRVVGSAHIPCGDCARCRSGLALHCPHATTLGLDRDGCFAQAFTVPAASLVPVPDSLEDDRAVFAHSLGRVLHAMHMLRLEAKTFVSIIGDGAVAMLAAQVMTQRNASVRLLGTDAASFDICDKWGIRHRPQREVGRRHDQDVIFDCTGSAESIDLALGLVRPRGTIILMREPGDETPIAAHAVMRDELHVFGSRGSAVADAVNELSAKRVDVLSLIARKLRFDDGPAALEAAAQPGTLKILLDAA